MDKVFKDRSSLREVFVIDKDKILAAAQKHILKGQSKKAIKEFLRLVEASPKDKRLYLKLGDLYLKESENDKAIKAYLKVADLYAEDDLNARAISIYKKVLSLNPNLIEAMYKIADLYIKEGLIGSAKGYYQSILRIRPHDPEALKCLKSLGNLDFSREETHWIQEVASLLPEVHSPPEPLVNDSAVTLNTSEPIDLPAPSPEPGAPGEDKEAETHYHLGIAYKEMELYDYAIAEFEMAAVSPAMKFDCCIMLGDCYNEKGLPDKSIELYTRAAEAEGLSNEKLARLHCSLGAALEANGSISQAIEAYHKALEFDHTLSEAQQKLSRLRR